MISGQNNAAPTNLNSMTKAQLLEYADKNGVVGVSGSMKKAEILNAIQDI